MARADLPLPTPKSRRRREELLVAAQKTFERLGYFETRASDIAKAAGVALGTFYSYFDSKDHVLRELIDVLAEDLSTASAVGIVGQKTPLATMQVTIRAFIYAYRDRAALIAVLEQATASNDEFLHIRLQIRQRFGAQLETELRRQLASHPSSPKKGGKPARRLDPKIGAYALGGMVEDFARGCYILGVLVDEDLAIDTLALIWIRSIGPADTSV